MTHPLAIDNWGVHLNDQTFLVLIAIFNLEKLFMLFLLNVAEPRGPQGPWSPVFFLSSFVAKDPDALIEQSLINTLIEWLSLPGL